MARTVFVVTDTLREKVRYLAGLGVPQDDVAKIIGCAPKTLRKRFRDELDRGVAEANATISGSLFGAAKGRKCYGADLLVEDEGALAGRVGGGRPGPERRCRVQFGGSPRPARQQPRSRADPGAARCTTEILRPETPAVAARSVRRLIW